MAEEFIDCERIVQADPRWQEAMRRRGVTDFSLAMVDPWASSWTGPDDDASGRRIARPLTFVRSAPGENGYARPVEGLICVVDLDAGEVIEVIDHGVVPLPTRPGNYEEPWIFESGNVPPCRALPRRRQADRDHAARGPELHRRRARRRMAEVAAPDRLHAPRRAWSCTRSATRDGRSSTGPRSSRCTCPTATRPPPTGSRTCSTRVSTASGWLANSLDAGLRLRRAHPLLRRRRQRQRRRLRRDPERHLHARGGRGHRVEAHGLPHRGDAGAAAPSAGDLDDRHRRQLRVRVLLVPLQRRHDRVRDQAHRRHLHRRDRPRRDAAARHAGRPRPLRPPSPALLLRAPGDGGGRRRGTPSSRSTRYPAHPGPTTRTATRGRSAAPCWRARRRRSGDVDTARARYWKIESAERVVRAGRTDRPTR